jgi:hypothetical protein
MSTKDDSVTSKVHKNQILYIYIKRCSKVTVSQNQSFYKLFTSN